MPVRKFLTLLDCFLIELKAVKKSEVFLELHKNVFFLASNGF